MQTDQLSFERFEELFDSEDEALPAEPSFDDEWKRCHVRKWKIQFWNVILIVSNFQNLFLHTYQPAIFVAVGDVLQFIDKPTNTLKLFVSYEVKSETTTARMTLSAGEITIDHKTICDSESQLSNWKSDGNSS